MTSFSLYHDHTKITKKMEGVVHDNKYHYKTKTRHTTKKGTIGAEKKLWHNYSLTQEGWKGHWFVSLNKICNADHFPVYIKINI